MKTIEQLFEDVFTLDRVELEGDSFWDVEDILGEEFTKVFGKGHVDDLTLSVFASNTEDDPRIHGTFRCCVYGNGKYRDLEKRLYKMKSDNLKVCNLYHPQLTIGISFSGVYEDDNTTYIGGYYELRK